VGIETYPSPAIAGKQKLLTDILGSGALKELLSIRVPYWEDTRMTKPIEGDTIYRCRRFSAETIELCVAGTSHIG
jgi:hypothetical protein